VAESSESFRAADREQFYVSASRFKEALTIYTDDKYQLLEAVRKSSHRPSATDLVKKEISESVRETEINKPAAAKVAENEQEQIAQKTRPLWFHKPAIRKAQSRGVGI